MAETGIQARDGRDVGSETRRCILPLASGFPVPDVDVDRACGCECGWRISHSFAASALVVPAGPSVSVRCWSTCLLRMYVYVQYYVVVRGCRNGSILASLLSTPCPLCPRRGVRRHGTIRRDDTGQGASLTPVDDASLPKTRSHSWDSAVVGLNADGRRREQEILREWTRLALSCEASIVHTPQHLLGRG